MITEKKLNVGKQKDYKEVVKKVVSKSGATKTPAGTPSVSDSDGDDDEHSGQAVYHGEDVKHTYMSTIKRGKEGAPKKTCGNRGMQQK